MKAPSLVGPSGLLGCPTWAVRPWSVRNFTALSSWLVLIRFSFLWARRAA